MAGPLISGPRTLAVIVVVVIAAQLAAPCVAEAQSSTRRLLQNDDNQPLFPGQWGSASALQGFLGGGGGGGPQGGQGTTRTSTPRTTRTSTPTNGRPSTTSTQGTRGNPRGGAADSGLTGLLSGLTGLTGQTGGTPRRSAPLPRATRSDWQALLTRSVSGQVQQARNIRRQRVTPTTAAAQSIATALGAGNSRAATQNILTAAARNPAAAAEGIVASLSQPAASTAATSEALAQSGVRPGQGAQVLAESASLAVNKGLLDSFGKTMADAFASSARNRNVPQLTQNVAQAINTGGPTQKVAFGQAIAQAVAGDSTSKSAMAEATATAYCSGGSTAAAWSSAYAVALTQNAQGCIVLNQAKALANARCGGGQFTSTTDSQATSQVLGFCGLLPQGVINTGFSTTQGNAQASQGGVAGTTGAASAGGFGP